METPATFEGWAIIELFGHQREVGFVTSVYFGTACLFRIDVPEMPARDFELKRPEYVNDEWIQAGAKVRREAFPARSRLVGPSAIYALNPCTEESARIALEELAPRKLILLEVPKSPNPAMLPGESMTPICEDCGRYVRDCDCEPV